MGLRGVFIGIVAGFTFLVAFFAGVGIAADTRLVVRGVFAVVTVVITLLLFDNGSLHDTPR